MHVFWKALLSFILDYLWAKFQPYVKSSIEKIKRKPEQDEKTKKLEESNDKGASVDEKVKAEKEFLNS